tara:strand:- start:875 stop:3022 length:2148 start_codon:yes stop_codon:yes gene_type:complete
MIDLPLIATSSLPVWIVLGYLLLLLALGVYSGTLFRGTSKDYFVASRSIGSFMLLMSVFGTTMTGFALVGSTGKAFTTGVATYGALASWSGIIHSAVFFVIGLRLWAIGKRHGYVTQVEFFRARFNSHHLGTVLFVLLVLLIIPYLLIGIISAGKFVQGTTKGMFEAGWLAGGIPPWLTGLIICSVVLSYVFLGGVRSAAWANTFQTIIFMLTGVIAFLMISKAVADRTESGSGSVVENVRRATELVEQKIPDRLTMGKSEQEVTQHAEQTDTYDISVNWFDGVKEYGLEEAKMMLQRPESLVAKPLEPKPSMSHMVFITFLFIPLSVGMFPHVFQHWLTAKSAKSFRLAIVGHPICIAIVWLPCILIGVWAAGLKAAGELDPPSLPLSLSDANKTVRSLSFDLHEFTKKDFPAITQFSTNQWLAAGTEYTEARKALKDASENMNSAIEEFVLKPAKDNNGSALLAASVANLTQVSSHLDALAKRLKSDANKTEEFQSMVSLVSGVSHKAKTMVINSKKTNMNTVLGAMVGQLVGNPWLLGLLMAGVLAAIMSSLDSQFACLGTMFTNDIVIATKGKDFYSDADKVKIARWFVIGVVTVAFCMSLLLANSSVFNLGLWCFSGFTALFPIVVAALYWKRATAVGAFACIFVTAVLWTYWFHQSGYGANKAFAVYGMLPVAPLTLASSAALVIGSLCSKSPESRLVNRFFPRAQNGA